MSIRWILGVYFRLNATKCKRNHVCLSSKKDFLVNTRHETAHTQFSVARKIDHLMPEAGSSICSLCTFHLSAAPEKKSGRWKTRCRSSGTYSMNTTFLLEWRRKLRLRKRTSIRRVTFWLLDESMVKFSYIDFMIVLHSL